jgi:hypothetical protein
LSAIAFCGDLCANGNDSLKPGFTEKPSAGMPPLALAPWKRSRPKGTSALPSLPTITEKPTGVNSDRQWPAVRMRSGAIRVPVQPSGSQATYGAPAIGALLPPETAAAGVAATAIASAPRTARTAVRGDITLRIVVPKSVKQAR